VALLTPHAQKNDCMAQAIIADGIFVMADARLMGTLLSLQQRYEGLLLNREIQFRLTRDQKVKDIFTAVTQRLEAVMEPENVQQSRRRAYEQAEAIVPLDENLWHPHCIAMRAL
jgi:hypothetical protein